MKPSLPAALAGSLLALAACHSNPPEPKPDPTPSAVPGFLMPAGATSGATLSFQNTSQHAVAYRWNFGDGSSPDRTESPTHTYTKAGTYQVLLRAYGAQKDSADFTQSLTVAGLSVLPSFVLPAGATSGATLSFLNTSQHAVAYRWSFGDGSSPDRTQSPTHTYAKAGTYQVLLRAYGAQKDSVDITQSLTVAGLPDGLVGRYFGRIYRVYNDILKPATYSNDTLTVTVSKVDGANVLVFGDKLTSVPNAATPNPLVSYAIWEGHRPSRPYYSFGYDANLHFITKLQRETAGDSVYIYQTGGGLGSTFTSKFYGKKR